MRTLYFRASLPFAFATTCRFACPPVGADQVFTQPTRTFTSGLSTDRSPSPPPDMTTGATGQVPLAGLSPARTPTSFAAALRPGYPSRYGGRSYLRPGTHRTLAFLRDLLRRRAWRQGGCDGFESRKNRVIPLWLDCDAGVGEAAARRAHPPCARVSRA